MYFKSNYVTKKYVIDVLAPRGIYSPNAGKKKAGI
jgi:hypothetical protein